MEKKIIPESKKRIDDETYPSISSWQHSISPSPQEPHPCNLWGLIHITNPLSQRIFSPSPSPITFKIKTTCFSLCNQPSWKNCKQRQMAAMATSTTIAGLGASPLCVSRTSSKPSLNSSFLRSQVSARNPLQQKLASGGRFTCFERDWLRRDLNVIGFGLIGWIAPSSIPVINGKSLTGLFFESIGAELAHWPTGPALTSQFWLWMITWHLGLFLCLTFGQIGFKGRTEEYF